MQTYETLHELFPSKKLVRKILKPQCTPDAFSVVAMRTQIQASILVMLESSDPAERVYLTRNGRCLLYPFLCEDGAIRELELGNDKHREVAIRRLTKELRKIAHDGIDVDGQGMITIEGNEVVYVPKAPPTYGNILLFDPYFKHSK